MKVREAYVIGFGVSADVDVAPDFTGERAEDSACLGEGDRLHTRGSVEVILRGRNRFRSVFGQALWPAMMDCLYIAYEVLVAKGYSREAMVLELYASRETADIFLEMALKGITEEFKYHSPTAQYGYLSRRKGGAGVGLRQKMEATLEGIRSGSFTRELGAEASAGYPKLKALREEADTHPMVAAEQSIIALLGSLPAKAH